MVRAETRIDSAQLGEAFEEEPGPHQQNEGKRHFTDHQQIAHRPAAGAGAAAPAFFQNGSGTQFRKNLAAKLVVKNDVEKLPPCLRVRSCTRLSNSTTGVTVLTRRDRRRLGAG